jgi:hypothetical protein
MWLTSTNNRVEKIHENYDLPELEYVPQSELYNPILNEEQKLAVSVVLGKPVPPCVIFGPPGTGKVNKVPKQTERKRGK